MVDPLHIVCPHCATVIRVPAARLGHEPKCASCHHPLFQGHPTELTAASFDQHIGRSDIPVVVDFWAPWCGPCVMMAPAYEKAAATLEPHYRLAKLDTESEPSLGARFDIRSIPTLVVFSGGREVARQSGAIGTEQIVRWVRSQPSGTPTAAKA